MYKGEMLSDAERLQFGKPKPGSSFSYVNEEEWEMLRLKLVEDSLSANPHLDDPTMTAYTPGETEKLLRHPEVVSWHKAIGKFVVPDEFKIIILVPCAKTKPWDEPHSKRSPLYRSYNQIINKSQNGEIPKVYFATISEPLGIVPQEMWSNFPQYDNPGLFEDDYLRTGFVKEKWKSVVGEKRALPFDKEMYRRSISCLGKVVADFIENNNSRRILSFVDNGERSKSTHGEMLDSALRSLHKRGVNKFDIERYPKRRAPRELPMEFILSKI